ncbi:alpha/beta fold hydrolase [Sphingomonas sp. MMS24-J45]|uniref:alpha/beta fold hydrolase n=1 Tax=Sphingomonas sp. MMS24-J45 TaxID=3238806 RepID=UPI00384D2F36
MEGKSQETPVPGKVEIAYGTDSLQKLDFWRAKGPDAPLLIFVHGGGWKRGDKSNTTGAAKVSHTLAAGYAFASIDYRLVPQATVEEQAQDVADAVAALRGQAAKLGFDPTRIVLMGHSAGAHLAALVGTDPRYFAKAGLKPDAVRGVILLDGAAYDVPRQIAEGGNFMHDTYVQAFGSDVARQKALSPTLQVAAPNAPDFLILHIAREDGTAQSVALGAALRAAGTPAEVKAVEGKGLRGHMEINRKLGEPDYPATALVDAYLKRRFAR